MKEKTNSKIDMIFSMSIANCSKRSRKRRKKTPNKRYKCV
jgi:hypothetical protein